MSDEVLIPILEAFCVIAFVFLFGFILRLGWEVPVLFGWVKPPSSTPPESVAFQRMRAAGYDPVEMMAKEEAYEKVIFQQERSASAGLRAASEIEEKHTKL